MSSITSPSSEMTPIKERLHDLRGQLLRFVFIDGFSRLLAVVVLLVFVDVFIDRVFHMDFAQRLIMLMVLSAGILATVFTRLLRPLFQRTSDDALLLQVEDHNQQLNESLISSFQFARESNAERQGISPQMVHATIKHGAQMAQGVDFGNAINRTAQNRNLALLVAGLLGVALIGIGVASSDFWNLWFRRNIMLTNDPWPKSTRLIIVGAQGNEMILPRGEDYPQFVEVDPTSSVKLVDVSIEFDDGSTRTHQKMRRTGKLDGRQHMLVFRNIANEFRFRAKGGDDISDWVQVRLVEPPSWSQLDMVVQMPDYTGIGVETLPQGSGPHSVLAGSALGISAAPNKALGEAKLLLANQDQHWKLAPHADGRYRLQIPPEQLVGGKYVFELADTSGLRSGRPATFTLKIKPDRPPQVRATLFGISGSVVPRARIPVSFTAADEYAVTQVELTHVWKSDADDAVPQQGAMDLGDVQGQIGRPELRAEAVLDLEPLQVPVGVSARIAVQATDNNTLTGPGVGKSREFLLRVVTEEELRQDLLRREIEQRKAFELALRNQEELAVELRALAANLQDESQAPSRDEQEKNLREWLRLQKLIGTNIATVADRFEEFLVEIKNNRLDEAENEIDESQSIERRFMERIISPIRQLDQFEIIRAAQQIDACQRSIGNPAQLAQALGGVSATHDAIIEAMQKILSNMEDSETYQEIVNKVIEVKRSEEKVRELARQRNQESGGDNIFDDVDNDENEKNKSQSESSAGKKKGGDDRTKK